MGMEGIDFQLVDIRFDKGLDTRTQRKLVVPGKWDYLENLTLTKDYTLRRRDGVYQYAQPPSGLNSGVINGLATYNRELVGVCADTAITAIPSVWDNSAGTLQSATAVDGKLGYCKVQKAEINRSKTEIGWFDCATIGNFVAYTWKEQNGYAYLLICDKSTGARLSLTSYINLYEPRLVAVNTPEDAFYLFGRQVSLQYIDCVVATVSAINGISVGSQTTLFNSFNLSTQAQPDAVTSPSQTYPGALLAYGYRDGTTSVRVSQITHIGGSTTPSVVTTIDAIPEASQGYAGIHCLSACAVDTENLAVFSWGDAGVWGASFFSLTPSWTLAAGATQLDTTSAGAPAANSASHIASCWNSDSEEFEIFTDWAVRIQTANCSPITRINCAVDFSAITTSVVCNSNTCVVGAGQSSGPQGPFILGKPYYRSGVTPSPILPTFFVEYYSAALGLPATTTNNTTNTNLQMGVFFLDGVSGEVLAKALYGSGGCFRRPGATVPPYLFTPGSAMVLADGPAWMCPEITSLTLNNGLNVAPTNFCQVTLAPQYTTPPATKQLGQSLFFAGGVLSTYDGASVVEHGFNFFPEGCNVYVAAGATGVTAGNHQFVFVYEWYDNAGQRHQSAPSLPQNPSLAFSAGNLTAAVTVPTLQLTQKDVNIVAYMTTAGGATFYRVTTYSGVFAPDGVANNKAASQVQFTITSDDTIIAANEILYNQPTQGGSTLPNVAPPPCNVLAVHQNRLFTDVADSPFAFRYSQKLATAAVGAIGLQFNEQLGGVVDATSGGIVAIAPMDEKVIILCRRALYVVYGSGPDSSGAYNNYSEPQPIQSDVGCAEALSVLSMPLGIVFKSAKGWYLLGRDLSVQYIGAAVARYDSNSVSGAVMLEDRQECRFTSLSGYVLVYSYAVNQWSVFRYTFTNGIYSEVWWPTAGALMQSGQTYGLLIEVAGATLDRTGQASYRSFDTVARLGFARLSSLNGFQRVRWLYLTGAAAAAPTSTLTIGVDYNDAYSNVYEKSYTATVDLSAITFGNLSSIDLRHKLRRQKCKSVSFTFTETGNNGAQFLDGLQALTLQVGIKRGTNKLPSAQGVG